MSVELRKEAGDKILFVSLSGTLSKDDYLAFTPPVEEAVKEHGKIRMLVRMHDFHGWTAGALWEDIKFDVKHFSHIERLAIIGESRWEQGMAMFCKPFTLAKVRYFHENKADEAYQWIHEGIAVAK